MQINEKIYKDILNRVPILCVDILIKNKKNYYLLVKRNNEPLKNRWWIPGGRVHLGEDIEKAAIRKGNEELGIKLKKLKFVGFFERVFNKNSFSSKTKYHTLSIIFEAKISSLEITLCRQSKVYKWSKNLPKNLKIKS